MPYGFNQNRDEDDPLYNPLFASQVGLGGDDSEYKKRLMNELNAPPPQAADDEVDKNQLVAGLAQAANQLGTVGGKTADSSQLQHFADLMSKNDMMKKQNLQAATAKRQGLLDQLALLRDKSKENATQRDADRQFKLASSKEDFERKKELENIRNKNEIELANTKISNEKPKAPTESQTKYAYNASRALSAVGELDAIEKKGYDPSTYGAALRKTNIPFVGQAAANSDDRRYEKAGRALIASILRPESGGAITDQEWKSYGPIYLPAPGDDAETLASKKATRQQAIDSLVSGAGPGYDPSKSKSWLDYMKDYENEEALADNKPKASPDGLMAAEAPSSGPKIGDVVKGYKFKGGNPADKTSWEKQ